MQANVRGLIVALALMVIAVAASLADAQVQPGYAPFASPVLQDPDAVSFDMWQIVGRWPVSQAEVQAVLDAIDPGRYSVPASAGPGKTFQSFTLRYGRATVVNTGPLAGTTSGPSSSLILFVVANDNQTGAPVLLNHLDYAEQPGPRNTFFGAPVARDSEFDWDIREASGALRLEVRVNGTDGFLLDCEAEASANNPGTFVQLDPDPRVFRFLSDGPGGVHPDLRFGRKNGMVPLMSIKAKVHGGRLVTPGGIIEIKEPAQAVELRRLSQTPVKLLAD